MAKLVCPETGEEAASDTLDLLAPSGGLYDVQHRFPTGITRELFEVAQSPGYSMAAGRCLGASSWSAHSLR